MFVRIQCLLIAICFFFFPLPTFITMFMLSTLSFRLFFRFFFFFFAAMMRFFSPHSAALLNEYVFIFLLSRILSR